MAKLTFRRVDLDRGNFARVCVLSGAPEDVEFRRIRLQSKPGWLAAVAVGAWVAIVAATLGIGRVFDRHLDLGAVAATGVLGALVMTQLRRLAPEVSMVLPVTASAFARWQRRRWIARGLQLAMIAGVVALWWLPVGHALKELRQILSSWPSLLVLGAISDFEARNGLRLEKLTADEVVLQVPEAGRALAHPPR